MAALSRMITVEEVCQRYGLSVDEFLAWHNAMQRQGLQGLHTTKFENYRYSHRKTDCNNVARSQCRQRIGGLMSTVAVTGEASTAVGSSSIPDCPSTIQTGDLVVDLNTRVVSVDGKPVRLTGKEYGIFELLSLRKGYNVTKEMFLDHLYGGVHEPKIKIIDVFVCMLRKKLAQATGGNHYIETVWGRGYVLRYPAPTPAANTRSGRGQSRCAQ